MRVLVDAVGPMTQPRGISRVIHNTVPFLFSQGIEVVLALAPWQVEKYARLVSPSVTIATADIRRDGRLRRHLWHYRKLAALARTHNVDIVHLPDTLPVDAGVDRPVVVSIHDLGELDFPQMYGPIQRRYRQMVTARAIKSATAVTTVSKFSQTRLGDHFPEAAHKTFVVQNGPGLTPETTPPGPALFDSAYCLFVGSFQTNKNISRIVEGFLAAGVSGLSLVLAGTRHNDGRAWELAHRHSSVIVVESPDDSTLASLYAAGLFLVFPSLYEGFGLPILEGMSYSLPVVTSRGGATEEVAGGAAFLCDPADTSSIANAIATLANDGDLRRRLTTAGLARAKTFSWQSTAIAMANVYRSLV